MMILNRTAIPTEVLEKLLLLSARGTGKRINHKQAFIEVVRGRGWSGHGVAKAVCMHNTPLRFKVTGLSREQKRRRAKGDTYVWCNGYIKLWLNLSMSRDTDTLAVCERWYELMAHEWRHIYEDQMNSNGGKKKFRFLYSNPDGSAMIWRRRPHEKRAMKTASFAVARLHAKDDFADGVIECAVKLEEWVKGVVAKAERKLERKPPEPGTIVHLTKCQRDWFWYRVSECYDDRDKDERREKLIKALEAGETIDLADLELRKEFCEWASEMRGSYDDGESRSGGVLLRKLLDRDLWLNSNERN